MALFQYLPIHLCKLLNVINLNLNSSKVTFHKLIYLLFLVLHVETLMHIHVRCTFGSSTYKPKLTRVVVKHEMVWWKVKC